MVNYLILGIIYEFAVHPVSLVPVDKHPLVRELGGIE